MLQKIFSLATIKHKSAEQVVTSVMIDLWTKLRHVSIFFWVKESSSHAQKEYGRLMQTM